MSKQFSRNKQGIVARIRKALKIPLNFSALFKGKSVPLPLEPHSKPVEKPNTNGKVKTEDISKESQALQAQPVKQFTISPEEYELEKTQFPGSKKTTICDVVIGLDFGTSCTKVVLRTPYLHNNRTFAVPFTDLTLSKNPYLLPSKLWLKPDGKFLLRKETECQCFSGIKLSLLESRQEDLTNEVDLAVAYLALVLRFTRDWFLSTKEKIYGDFKLRWHANLGLPSIEYDTSHLSQLYNRILHAAWMLSLQSQTIRSPAPSNAFDRLTGSQLNKNSLDDVHLRVIPEVAAAVSGYARSNLWDPEMPSLHLLVDIGAGTLDVCGFVLHQREGDDRYSLLTTDVQLLGVIKLHENRLSVINGGMGESWDPYDTDFSIPSDIKDYLPSYSTLDEDSEKLCKADEEFSKQCQKGIRETVHDLRTRRDPNSPCWQNSLPAFICGGGLNVPFYQEMVLEKVSTWLKGWLRNEGLKTNILPRPENLELESSDDYHRLAVAWGLSIPADDIGRIDPTQTSENIDPKSSLPPDLEDSFISKDMV